MNTYRFGGRDITPHEAVQDRGAVQTLREFADRWSVSDAPNADGQYTGEARMYQGHVTVCAAGPDRKTATYNLAVNVMDVWFERP